MSIRDEIKTHKEVREWGLRIVPDELYNRALPYFTEASKFFNTPLYRWPMRSLSQFPRAIWGGLELGYIVRESDKAEAIKCAA